MEKVDDNNTHRRHRGRHHHGAALGVLVGTVTLLVLTSSFVVTLRDYQIDNQQQQLRRSLQEVPPPEQQQQQQQPPPPPPEQQQQQQPPTQPETSPPPPQPEGGVPLPPPPEQQQPPPPEQQQAPPPDAAAAAAAVAAAAAASGQEAQAVIPPPPEVGVPASAAAAIPPPPLIGDAAAAAMQQQQEQPRPIMHTFYTRIDPTLHHKNTAMSDQADEKLIEAWKMAWSEAGWEPRVLTLEDAKRHPHFAKLDAALAELPFGYYDRLCFLRWIAMAASGGGYMSDYDTFPLNAAITSSVPLPHNGRLTVYNRIPAGGAVPCLVSGTAQEWDRVGRLLIDNAVAHRRAHFWSDMFALVDIDLQAHGVHYEIENQVVAGHRVLTGHHWGPTECEGITQGMRAVHFSHDALDRGTLREGEVYEDRPAIAIRWVHMWKERCPPSNVPR